MKIFSAFILIVFTSVCMNANCQNIVLTDAKATKETVCLYHNLKKIADEKTYLFGHQDDLAYGVNWRYKERKSDVMESCGDYPALYGWDLGRIENADTNNIDGVPFRKMKKYIQDAYNRGGVITISWHMNSPLGNSKSAWDTTHGTLATLLPSGTNHELFKTWLNNAAVFLSSLKGKNGEAIPVIFRPFHEQSGNWFWWCRNACSEQEFKIVWRYIVYYLRNEKQLHNLIFNYNVSDIKSKEDFYTYYPGNDVVDMVSFDNYQNSTTENDRNWFIQETNRRLDILDVVAAETHKIPALAETGLEAIPDSTWWTNTLTKAIGNHAIAYILLWRNHGYNEYMKKMHYYVPYEGQISKNDFIKYYGLPQTLFQKEVAVLKVYE